MREFRLSNADYANKLLRGEIDVNQYWRESGKQQVESAGVFLTQEQQARALKNLARLVANIRASGLVLSQAQFDGVSVSSGGDELQSAFNNCLATYR